MESGNSSSQLEEDDLSAYISFRDDSRFWCLRVLLPVVLVIGIIGNGMTMVVLTRRRMRSSTNSYLTALAVSDLLYLLFVFYLSLEHYPNVNEEKYFLYWSLRRFDLWLTDATNGTSIWLTVSFTVERYIAVCHPMRGKIMCTESRARVVIIAVFLLSFLVTITTPFEWETVIIVNNSTGERQVQLQETTFGKNIMYKTVYYWFWSIAFVLIPLLLLAIFNSFLINAVHQSRKRRCIMTQTEKPMNNQSQENKITITLIAVVILFIVCQIPIAIILIYSSLVTRPGKKAECVLRGLGSIGNFLVTFNAAANFILYCVLSAKYRRTLLRTFFGKCYQAPSPGHSSVHTPEISRLMRGSTVRSNKEPNPRAKSTSSSFYLAVPKNAVIKRQASLYTSSKVNFDN